MREFIQTLDPNIRGVHQQVKCLFLAARTGLAEEHPAKEVHERRPWALGLILPTEERECQDQAKEADRRTDPAYSLHYENRALLGAHL